MGLGEQLVDALLDELHGKVNELLERIDGQTVNEADDIVGDTPLHAACIKNNVEAVTKLLSISNVDVNARNNNGESPVMQSAYNVSSELLQLMLDDPRVDMDLKHYYRPIDGSRGLEEIVKDLGENKPEMFKCLEIIKEARRRRGLSQELIRRCSKKKGKICDFLKMVDSNIVNQAGSDGASPLHAACQSNNEKAVANLLATPSINVNYINLNSDWSPAMEAAAWCNVEALKTMLNDSRVNLDIKECDERGLEEIVGELYNGNSTAKFTCLEMIEKARRGRLSQELIQQCSKKNGKINDVLKKIDIDAINEASANGDTPLHVACQKNNKKAVDKLLSIPDIDINVRNYNNGYTPIMIAASYCSIEALGLILNHPSVNMDVRDNQERGLKEVVGELYNGNSTTKSTCLEMIEKAIRGRLRKELIQQCSKKNGKINNVLKKIDIGVINEAGANGDTPLHVACQKNNKEAIDKLLSIPDIDVNVKNYNNGYTPIMTAASYCSIEALGLILNHPGVDMDVIDNQERELEEVVGELYNGNSTTKSMCLEMIEKARREQLRKELIHQCSKINGEINDALKNIDIDAINEADADGETPLHVACQKNNKKAVDRLLSFPGIDINVRNYNNGYTPIMTAASYCSIEALGLILNHPGVDMDVTDNQERGLEEVVRCNQNNLTEKAKCLEMIREKREREDNSEIGILRKLDDISSKLDAAQRILECPVCMDTMIPPMKIWMCSSSHLICQSCKGHMEGGLCPTCRTERITSRAFIAEHFAGALFQ